jgi:hypothetical protein
MHVPPGAGPRHCESFIRWFTGVPQPPDEPLPELLLDAPLEDPLPELLLDPPEPLLDAPLEEPLPPELLPLESPTEPSDAAFVPSGPASVDAPIVDPPHPDAAPATTTIAAICASLPEGLIMRS